MKVRIDYVSNSSSCSFIVACIKDDLPCVLKKIAKGCEDKKSDYHNAKCVSENLRSLDFCTSAYELLFLGDLCVNTKKTDYNLEYFKELYDDLGCPSLPHGSAKEFFDEYCKNFKVAHDKHDKHDKSYRSSWIVDEYKDDEKIDDAHYVHYTYEYVSNIVFLSAKKDYIFGSMDSRNFIDVANCVDKIIAIAQAAYNANMNGKSYDGLLGNPGIYKITQSTIANTKALLLAGCKMRIQEGLVQKIENMLDTGHFVFHMRKSHDGDGYDTYNVYSENYDFDVGSILEAIVLTAESE